MKKLLAVLPASLLLAACATNAPFYHSMGQIQQFDCHNASTVNAQYNKKGDLAKLTVNLPEIGLNNQPITLEQDVSGSGVRYVNASNPDITYEWHTKADMGVISAAWADGRTYSNTCQLKVANP